jgi:hypothetical protein
MSDTWKMALLQAAINKTLNVVKFLFMDTKKLYECLQLGAGMLILYDNSAVYRLFKICQLIWNSVLILQMLPSCHIIISHQLIKQPNTSFSSVLNTVLSLVYLSSTMLVVL